MRLPLPMRNFVTEPVTDPVADDNNEDIIKEVPIADDKAATSVENQPATLTRRSRSVPDVPEDVDFLMEHLNDPNYDLRSGPAAETDSLTGRSKKEKALSHYSSATSDIDTESHFGRSDALSRTDSRLSALEFDDESPYPEVRASVSSSDDPTMPVNTFRMWFLGLFFSIVIAGMNQVFSYRYPSVYITGLVCQLLALPMGKGLERILPTTRVRAFGNVWSLNPGPFNIKEHVCITVMANVVVLGAYATDVTATQRIFYAETYSFSYSMCLVLGSQILGFSLGGLLRQWVVWPSSMIWPGALVNAALFNTLHKSYGVSDRPHMSREKFFFLACLCSFIWYWVPGFLFTGLSVFNWACWIAPNNVAVNALFGTNYGLGMGILTFDWAQISYLGSPLVVPWWAELNTMVSFILFFWIICPAIYFSNSFFTGYLPISARTVFDNTGSPYEPSRIVKDATFQQGAYEQYSPTYFTAAYIVTYSTSFAAFTSVLVHTFIWYRKDIYRRFFTSLKDERDVHSRLMQAYPEVPGWWYVCVGVSSFTLLLVSVEIFPTQMPIWGACLAFAIATIVSVPLAMIQAITNQQIALNIIHEMIAGYVLPGRPVANMIFKAVAYIGTSQALQFSSDLKLGHYMKIPPRMMFMCQLVAAVVSCFVVNLVQDWMFSNVENFCTRDAPNGFICPSTNTFATASLVWGGVGPHRLFSPGGMYNPIMYFFLIGAFLPIPFYLLAKRYPLSLWRYINVPVFFSGVGQIPPASGINYASWAAVGFIFNYLIRRFHFRWWMRYNYILSAALDAGVGIALIIIFFAVQYPKGGFTINWWGNTGWMNTADANGTPRLTLGVNQTFGLKTWH